MAAANLSAARPITRASVTLWDGMRPRSPKRPPVLAAVLLFGISVGRNAPKLEKFLCF